MNNHYDWLEKYFPAFLAKMGIDFESRCPGIAAAHGDKCYCYKDEWEAAGVPFNHGVAIYLLGRLRPFSDEIRDGIGIAKVDIGQWVIDNYKRFLPMLDKE